MYFHFIHLSLQGDLQFVGVSKKWCLWYYTSSCYSFVWPLFPITTKSDSEISLVGATHAWSVRDKYENYKVAHEKSTFFYMRGEAMSPLLFYWSILDSHSMCRISLLWMFIIFFICKLNYLLSCCAMMTKQKCNFNPKTRSTLITRLIRSLFWKTQEFVFITPQFN